jgi:hypothetical protein
MLGMALASAAVVAANLAVVGEVIRTAPTARAAWVGCGLILGTNGILCALFGLVLRFRFVPLMGIFTVAALTEALLWRSAASGRNSGWIAVVAILGGCLLAGFAYALRGFRRRRSQGD